MNTKNRVHKMAHKSGFAVETIHMLHSDFEFRAIPPLFWVEKMLHLVLDTRAFSTLRADILAILVRPPKD
jgi:hypothetical protein